MGIRGMETDMDITPVGQCQAECIGHDIVLRLEGNDMVALLVLALLQSFYRFGKIQSVGGEGGGVDLAHVGQVHFDGIPSHFKAEVHYRPG